MIRLSSLLEHQDKKVHLENNTKEKGASKNGVIQGMWGQKRKGRGGDHEKRGEEAGGKQLGSSEAAWAGGQRRSPLPTRPLGAQQSANPDIELLCD